MKQYKIIILAFVLLFGSYPLDAKTRSYNEAAFLAAGFIKQRNGQSEKAVIRPARYQVQQHTDAVNPAQPLYIFNVQNNGGFVIVSGDDRVKPILGYSDSGTIETEALPDNLKSLLQQYSKQIEALKKTPERTVSGTFTQTNLQKIITATPVVSALLGNTKWGQSQPFNIYCPYDNLERMRTYTGCVATAMAQIMYYYKWPVTGTGSKSYDENDFGTLSANFGQTSYNWGLMQDSYNGGSTPARDSAVALLLYHCGISVEMDYSVEGSGATPQMAAKAMKTYFGYDNNIQLLSRGYYSNAQWESLIKRELDAARPVFYAGSSETVGHAFVCDGYDTNGFFHINWGWNGYSNGYFELISLSSDYPETTGATEGYLLGQEIITGIQKPDGINQNSYQMYVYSNLKPSVNNLLNYSNSYFNISLSFYNSGANDFSGTFGFAVRKAGSTTLSILGKQVSPFSVPAGYGSSDFMVKSIRLSSNMTEEGTYYLYPVYRATDSTGWSILRGSGTAKNYLVVTRSGTSATFSQPVYPLDLTLSDSVRFSTTLMQYKPVQVSVPIRNQGSEYCSYLELYLYSTTDTSLHQVLCKTPVIALPGSTLTYKFYGTPILPSGNYYLKVRYDTNNAFDGPNLADMGPALQNPIPVRIGNGTTESLIPKQDNTQIFVLGRNILVESSSTIRRIQLLDLNGRLLFETENRKVLEMDHFTHGLYVVRVETSTGVFVQKIRY